ncbi:unnamed protein product [Rotaria sordida]|uniref:Uncharacterized protein n=1 Tax=Rotaria sordida TaxID=392033 RepID=A0A818WJH3_9BILA|nr:unnamed protein product [Rotaria sordida]
MANRVSLSFNSKNHNQNISLSNNPSIYTTNTSYNILSTNLYPTYSMNRHSREYEPSYPSITRYRTSSSSSPYRKTHYLDDSVEEIIHEEILDIINLDHYPTLLERWGDDTRAIIKEEGEFIIEDYVEFEELEPTITEEISYEITYSNNEIKSTREIHHSHLESRNFRKIKKRRIKRKHPIHDIHTVDIDNRAIQLLDDMHNLSIKIDSIIQTTRNFDNDLSGDDYDEFTNIDHAMENIITTNDLEQTYKTIPTINNGTDHSNINIIANETSFFGNKENVLKTSKSNEQQEYQNNLISQRIEDEKKDNKESRSSYSILMNDIHIPFDEHEIISTIESSINKENKKILKSDQQNIINEQEKMIIQKQILNHDEIQSNQNQTSIDTKFISSIENDHQSLIAIEQEIKHYFDDDLLSFLKILLSHLISNSIDDNDQSLICPTNQNMSINKYNDSDVETFQSNMKFEELKNIDKPLTNSYINHENILSKSNISETKQEIISKDRTKSNEIEHLSSKVLTKQDDEILTTPFNFRSPSDNVKINLTAQQENIHDDTSTQIPESINIVTDKQKAMFEELQLSIEEEIKEREPKCLSLTNPTIEINAQSNKSFLSSHSKTTDETNPLLESTIINEEQKSILKDHLSTIDNISQENKSENLSSNALIQIVHEIFTTPINIKSETIQSFEKKVDQPSINSLVEIIQQIKNIPLTKISKIKYDSMENICENKNQLDSNIISSVIETLQEPFYDTKQTFPEQTTVSSNYPASHQRADKIKTDITTNSEEKIDKISSNNLNIEIDKQPKTMSTQLATRIISEKEIIQKPYVNEDENVELPSDFLADIVRQIRATVSTIHFPLIDHTQQIVENLPNDFIKETTAQTCITSIPATHIEDNKQFESTKNFPTTENVHQTNFDDKLELSTTSIIPELPNTTCQDESLHDIDTYDNLQQSTDINSINQITIEPSYSISELTNIMNDILNFQMITSKENFTNIPQQSKIIEQITSTKTFSPETDFQDFYQKQYSSFPNVEHLSLDFIPIDNKQLEMKETTPDLTKTYYELKEQRYSQPLHVYEQTEQKQKTSNNNLNNHVEQIDLTSFSQISNLPSREYRQVFGVSHEVVNTINDLTDSIDQIIHSNVSDEVKPIIDDSNEKSQLIETFEDHPSIAVTNQAELINEPGQSIISNIELDFRYCSLLNQLDTLIKPILNLPSTSFINENESILSKIDEEKDNQRHLTERSDLLTNHINRLDDSTNASPIIKTTDIDKQVSPLLSDDQYTELLNKRPSSDDEISHTTAPYPSTETKIISSLNTIESTDTFKNKTPALPNQSTTIISSNPLKIESNIVSNKLQVNDTQPDRLSSIQQTSIDDHKQQDEAVSKPSSQKLQVLYDDYPWYSSYYTIADAELKIPQLYKQLNFVNEQNRSPTKVELQEKLSTHDHKLENKQDQGDDDEGFHIVQRRKRIPSSTTQTKTLPSTITTIKPPINSDIDLEPVILHGHSTTTITTSPIISQTITIPSKTKHKKKKKDKTEMIFFDAPQLITSDVNKQKSDAPQSQLVEQERPKNIEIVDSSQINQREKYEDEQLQPMSTVISTEQQQPEDLSTSVLPNTDELKQMADHKNELTSNDVSQLPSTPVETLSREVNVDSQTIEQQSIDKQSILQPSPSSTLTTLSSSPQTSTDHLKQQDEVAHKSSTQNFQVHYDDYPWNSSYYTIADAELKIPQLYEQLNFVNEQNHSPTKVELQEKLSTHDHKLENEQDQGDDNEGFHIVQRRKRIPSSTTQTKTSPSTITTIKPPINLDIDLEPVILHGHSTTTITTSPVVPQTTTIPTKTKHKKKKKDKTEMIFFDAPQLITSDVNKQKSDALQSQLVEQERPKHIEIVDSSQINQTIKHEYEQLHPIPTAISSEQQKPEVLLSVITSNIDNLKQIVDKENELTSNDVSQSPSTTVETLSREINVDSQTIEQQSTDKEPIKPSSPSSITTTTTPTHTKVVFLTPEEQEEEDNEGFQVIQHQKHITSAQRSRKPLQSPTTSKTNYKQNIGRDIDLKPVALHEGHDSASRSIPHSPPLSEPTSTSTSQSGKSDDKVLTSNVTDNEVVIARTSEVISTDVKDAHEQQLSYTGLFEIMKDVLSTIAQTKTTPSSNVPEQTRIVDRTVEEKASSNLVDYGASLVTKDIPSSTSTLFISEPTEETTHPVMTTTLIEKQVPSQVTVPIKDITSTTESTIITSQAIKTNEDDKQQQVSSIGMFDEMKNLSPSTLLSETSNETSSETIQPIVKAQEKEDTVKKYIDINDSSNISSKPTSNISSTDTDHPQNYTTTDKSITSEEEEEHHNVFDLVVGAISNLKETISNLGSSGEKPISLESPLNLSDKSMINIPPSNDLDNEKKQQTVIQSVKEIVDKIHQTILPTEEQIIRTPQQSLISNYSSISNQSQPTDTQGDHLSSIHQTSIDNYKQQYVFENKPSYKNLQVLYDNYPWYSSYYTIADAEAKIFCLNKQLNLVHEQNHSLTTVDVDERLSTYDHELENEKDKDDDDDNEFQIIQGQKHISSSTIHGRTSPSTITTTKPPISSDIDLEPVTHHGHPTVPIITSPIVSQTTTIPSKKKHKKKKKDKKEIILFDTPELISSIPEKQKSDVVQSELIEQKNLMNIDIIDSSPINQTKKHECKQLHPISTIISKKQQKSEVLSTVITSNIDKLKQKADKKNKLISKDVSKLLSTPVTTVSEKAKINDQTIEQQSIDKKPILQSSPSSMSTTTTTIRTKVIPPPPAEEEEDNEGFQLVHYHKRILTATKSEKPLSPLTTTSKEILNSDIDLKTSVIHEHQNLPTSTIDVTQSTTSKKKKNKHKKLKKEIVSSSSIDSTNAEQQMTHQETIIQTPILSSSSPLIEDSKIQSKSTIPSIIKPTKILTKISPSSEEEDNEGFQVVHYRKNMTSALQSRKAPQSPTTPKTIYEQNISRNIGLKPVVSQERHDSTSRSIPRTTATSKTPSNKQQKDQTSLINTLPRSASTETHHITSTNVDNSFDKSKIIKQLESKPADIQQQLKDSKYETISSLKSKSDQSSPAEQSIKPIVKEYHMSTKTNGINTNDKSSTDKIISSTVFNTQKPTLIEDDDEDEFQLVRHHKHKTSTITKQPKITSTIDQKSTNNYTKQDSSTLKSKKFKKTNEHTLSSLITNNDFFPLAIEENLDQTINENIQQIPELQTKIANNFLSNSNKTISINPTYEIISSQINGQIHSTDNTQNQLQSKISNQQLSTLSNEFSNKINNLLKTEPIKSISLSQTSSTDILSTPTINTNDEQNKIISNEKIPKRRKKKLRTETKKDDDKNLLTSSTNTISTIQSDDNKEKSNKKSTTIVTQSITSLPNTSEISSIKKDKSQDIKIKIPENISLTSSKPIHLIQNQTSYEETNDKLDLFLPEYIRQQIHTHQTNSSSIDNSNITSTTTTTTSSSSSNIIPKKKPRSKMLKKDLEVKSLLTNEFDNIDKQNKSIIISSDNEDINDDDEFIIQTIHSNLSNTSQKELNNISTTEQNIDNILSHGFHHWLQESQALSQQKDKSLSNHSLTQAMQSIIIQPIENDEYSDDENSWNEFQTTKSTYIIGIRPEKKIHIHNAYSINCPESILTSSYLIHQSNNKTFKDDSRKYDSNNEEDDSMDDNTSKKQHSHQINTQSLTREKQQPNSINDNHLQISFTTDDVQRCLGEDFYDQISNNNINNNNNNNNHSNNYDDWAYFLEHENSYHIGYDLSSSLECFYVQTTLDDNTFLSNATSIHYSIQHEKQHYGDFVTSNNDIIIPESMIKLSSYKSKPSESFQNWKNHKLISNQSQNDDEILISHSTNGLCRQVTL